MNEWKELFNGRDLIGWEDAKNGHHWSVENETIVCVCGAAPAMSNLSTKEQYGDFELRLEYNADANANSGVFVRVSDLEDEVNTGLEVQILGSYGDDSTLGRSDCGALYDLVAPKVKSAHPGGNWNDLCIVCQGPMIRVDLNGERTVEADLDDFDTPGINPGGERNKFLYAWKTMPRVGHIGLQSHSSLDNLSGVKIRFRNIRLREL